MIRLEIKKKYNTISREKQKKLGKISKYEYHTGKEVLPFDQSRMIEQAKFTYSFLREAFGKQIKTFKNQ